MRREHSAGSWLPEPLVEDLASGLAADPAPAAVRQLAARARRHVQDGRPRFPPTPTRQRELLAAFTSACTDGDLDRLLPLLDPDVVWRADGGGKVTAAPGHAREGLRRRAQRDRADR
jgi:hypothetical protein